MNSDPASHFVFVDFENVPTVDLADLSDAPVHVTLLIGEKQRRLDLPLVHQIHQHAAQVTLVEVGASGRNALDLVLACHLGQTLARHPNATFYIVSRDKDFDPLIAHLKSAQIHVSRHNGFSELPCLSPARAGSAGAPSRAPVDKFEKLISTLARPNRSRPKRKIRLLSHIQAFFGAALPESELETTVGELARRGVLTVHADGRVTYGRPADREAAERVAR